MREAKAKLRASLGSREESDLKKESVEAQNIVTFLEKKVKQFGEIVLTEAKQI